MVRWERACLGYFIRLTVGKGMFRACLGYLMGAVGELGVDGKEVVLEGPRGLGLICEI